MVDAGSPGDALAAFNQKVVKTPLPPPNEVLFMWLSQAFEFAIFSLLHVTLHRGVLWNENLC